MYCNATVSWALFLYFYLLKIGATGGSEGLSSSLRFKLTNVMNPTMRLLDLTNVR